MIYLPVSFNFDKFRVIKSFTVTLKHVQHIWTIIIHVSKHKYMSIVYSRSYYIFVQLKRMQIFVFVFIKEK